MSRHLTIAAIALAALLLGAGCGKTPNTNTTTSNTTNTTNTNITNQSTESNQNTNTTSAERTVQGTVFVKSYQTPSESYGILASDGEEIGMGAYDSMREQLRPYVGDKIEVTFTTVCRPDLPNCCRTVFDVCGIVKSWKPLPSTNS